MRKTLTCTFLGLALSLSSVPAHEVGDQMAAAANDFLATLDPAQLDKVTFDFNDDERKNWHFVPIERHGLPLREMRPDQQHLAHGLLSTGLSHTGYLKAVQIMSLERMLWEIENQSPRRDAANYQLWIFGKPDPKGTWGWRWEGHHMSFNFTIVDGKLISETPNFFGANPGEVTEGPRAGLRVLHDEEDKARKLVTSLDDAQKAKAVIGEDAPKEILTKDFPKVEPLEPKGIGYPELTKEQQAMLMDLVKTYLFNQREELAEEELARVEKELDEVKFAWAGGLKFGDGHYYYVQGKSFLLEYVNVQNGGKHPHAAWRNFGEDFGVDLMREHLALYHGLK